MAEKKEAAGKKEAHGEEKKAVVRAEKEVKTEKAEAAHTKTEAPKEAAEKKAPKAEAKKKEEKKEKVDIVSETVYTIPFSDVYRTRPMYKRANKAVAFVKAFLVRHAKANEVVVDGALNRHIWARGCSKPPRRVQVKAVKDSKGRVTAMLLK